MERADIAAGPFQENGGRSKRHNVLVDGTWQMQITVGEELG